MIYKLHALPIWEQGKYRENQEDSIFPPMGLVTDDARLFMVCDGMGGHEAGEVASGAVIDAVTQRILQDSTPNGPFTDDLLARAITDAYDLLDERDPNPESIKRMGTTMTLLKFHANGATVAHIGDSRIYQFRKTDDKTHIIFKSVDHSLVNDLIKVGEMTEEEARTSPLRNRITRAMQSHLESRPKADVTHLTDIRPGDYFYLCSDGMLENADDDNLCFIFGHACSDEEKVNMLKGNSEDNRDNHSAMVVHVLSVDNPSDSKKEPSPAPAATAAESPAAPAQKANPAPPAAKANPAPSAATEDSIPTARPVQTQRPKNSASKAPVKAVRRGRDSWQYAILAALIALCALFLPKWCKSHTPQQNKKEQVKPDTVHPNPIKSTSPAKAPSKRPEKPAKPAKPVKPAKPEKPTEPAKPTKPVTDTPSQNTQQQPATNPANPASAPATNPTPPAGTTHQPAEAVSNETRHDEALDAYNNRQNDTQKKH